MIDLDDPASLAAGDPGSMLDLVTGLSDQVSESYRAAGASEGLPSGEGLGSVVFCGMGGSAVAGEFVRVLYRGRLGIPVDVNRSSVLPEFAGPHSLVLCSSYSGGTAETIATLREALRRGCRVVAITTGGELAALAAEAGCAVVSVPEGLQPRAAVGHLVGASLGALEAVGLIPPVASEIEDAGQEIGVLADRLGPGVPRTRNPAKELAWNIGDRTPVIWGADGMGAAAAARWKTQFNENAKVPAWAASMPELDHNEVVGWTLPIGEAYFVVALRLEDEPPDVAARFAPSLDVARESGAAIEEVWGAGRSPLSRLLSLVSMGDFASVYHALAHGIDPTPVPAIDRLKAALADS